MPPSEIAAIFQSLPKRFQKGNVKTPRTFYFSLDDEKWTVTLAPDACEVKPGKPPQDADCFFKASRNWSRVFRASAPCPSRCWAMAMKARSAGIECRASPEANGRPDGGVPEEVHAN